MNDSTSLQGRVAAAVEAAPVVDLHTHLFAPQFGRLNLWGIDELVTYHYLAAETLRAKPDLTPEEFYYRDKRAQADLVWETLFVRHDPVSEAASGVLTVLDAFGLDPRAKDLGDARAFFEGQDLSQHVDRVLDLAGVEALVMTNDPADPEEWAVWRSGFRGDPRFNAALRLDRVLELPDLRERLHEWIRLISPRYMAVSMTQVVPPPGCVLDACRDHGIPFAIMLGVRRSVNPRLRSAGDGVVMADLEPLERLAGNNPDVRFLVTTLARENAHGLCVLARKFANVLPFGCWWFMNNPSLVEDITLMRLEMLGPTFVPQHSDARILEQLVYKWRHSRRSIARALASRYEAMPIQPRQEQIVRDAQALMGGIARGWIQ